MPIETKTSPRQPAPLQAIDNPARPPERMSGWAEPNGEPILDAARVPLKAFRDNKPVRSATGMYLWLHVLRPVVLVLFWIGIGIYAWRHLFQPSDDPESIGLLAIYAVLIGLIFVGMLLIAPIRRRAHREDRKAKRVPDSSMAELADYAEVPPKNLSGWQHARRLVVRHDDEGRLRDASDLDTEPGQLEQLPAARKQRRA